MPPSLAADNPETLQFETTVEAIDGGGVVLEDTYFYPGGGGQPRDRGTIGAATITDITTADGRVVHHVDDAAAFEVGVSVPCQVDPSFRRYCRRAHTASHLLYGAGRRLLEDLGYGGFDIDSEKVRVDFETSTEIDDDRLVELERLTNRGVWDGRSVTWESVPQSEAAAREDVAFNTATEEGVMAEADAIRLVEIDGWDIAACGGTHVRNTIEVGPVTVLERSNPGEGLTRVEFTVGPAAIQRRATERRAALEAATSLGVPVTELDDGVADLTQRYETVSAERDELRERLVVAQLHELESVERDGATWRIGAVSGFDSNTVGEQVTDVDGDVVAVAGRDGSTFVVVASDGTVDAGAVVDAVTDEFGGGGGGSPAFAQGGGLDVAPEAVVEYLRSR